MNQILVTEKKKERSKTTLEIKPIIRFFAVTIMIFGIVLAGQGSYAIYKDIDDKKPTNIPKVTINRVNDKAIVKVNHNTEIVKLSYSWNNGAKTEIPINSLETMQEITLLGYDATLNLSVEDANGKQVNYQKQYLLTGEDITKPSIEVDNSNGLVVTVKDETAIYSLTYKWENEAPVVIEAETENQTEIKKEIETNSTGTRKIKIMAEDQNGNREIVEKSIVTTTARPIMYVEKKGDYIIVRASDKDGLKKITINLNGKIYTNDEDLNQKEIAIGPLYLREGNNTISVEVTNVSGYTEANSAELVHTSSGN